MIVYGIKTKVLLNETLIDACPNCGTSNTVNLHVFQKYAHLFFIPFLPAGKTAVTQCSHCNQVLKEKQMPESFKLAYSNLKSNSKTPIWMYSGIALVAVLIAFGVYTDKKKDEKNAILILAPQRGDVYEIKTKESQYTIYKVENVQGDSVFIRTNNFEATKQSGITAIRSKGDNAYSEEQYGFSKSELKQMFADKEILDIDRK